MIVLTLIIVLCLIFLSTLVASQGFSKAPNRALLISVTLLSAWMMMVLGLQAVFGSGREHDSQLVYARAVFGVGVLSLLSLVWFVATLLSMGTKTRINIRNALLIVAGLVFVLSMSPYVIVDATLQESSVMPIPYYGALMPIYVTVLAATIGAVLYMVLYGSAKEDEQYRRQQIRIVGVTIFLTMVSGLITNLIVPWLTGDAGSSLFMVVSITILIAGLTYAIIKHGLFDIKLAAVRSVTYLSSLAALAVIYYSIAYIVSVVIFREGVTTNFSISPLNIALALLLAFIFQPVKQFFDQITDRVFYRNRYSTNEFLIRIGRILTSTTELYEVLDEVGKEIRQTLKASSSLFVVYRDHHPNELVGEGIDERFDAKDLTKLDTLIDRGSLLIVDKLRVSGEEDGQALYEVLSKKQIALVLPLVSADEVIGYLMLGEHKAGMYTKQDTEALEAMANELVIAVQNARAVQAIRDLNAHLEQRIEAATSELLASNEKLRQLDAAKDEFVSMASHQLRTPLTSVKGYISMVLEGDAGKISPMQKQLLGEAFVSSERMVHLIGDFLNVSRLQTGKFVLDKNLANLADLVEEEVGGLRATAKTRSLKLEYRKPSAIPSLYIDSGKIHQVVMNFIDNAIYYSTDDTVITVKVSVEEGFVVFTVQDTGIGVPKSEQSGLFTKFFRATNARRQRPDGTGIGLYLAKKVIDAHDGTMIFSSVEGKGSTFGFRLPIKKLSENPVETSSEK